MRAALLAAGLAPLVWFAVRRATAPAEVAPVDDFIPGVNVSNIAEEAARAVASQPGADAEAQAIANLRAFLRMIRHAEGTGDADGYRALFGHRPGRPVLFDSFADHPRKAVQFRHPTRGLLWTSAAGAYQAMAVSPLPDGGSTRLDTWDRIQRKLGLPDFSPASQDQFATELIDEKGALQDVYEGRFAVAVDKVRGVWASLPGAGYGQPERQLAELQAVYVAQGGALA